MNANIQNKQLSVPALSYTNKQIDMAMYIVHFIHIMQYEYAW